MYVNTRKLYKRSYEQLWPNIICDKYLFFILIFNADHFPQPQSSKTVLHPVYVGRLRRAEYVLYQRKVQRFSISI